MVDASAGVTLPVSPDEAFAAATELESADWLPGVRRIRHLDGPHAGVGARYEAEVGILGRQLRGILVCREYTPPRNARFTLEEGLRLSIAVVVKPLAKGCHLTIEVSYSVSGVVGGAVERASAGAARREVARAVEQLAARLGRRPEGV